MGLTMSIVRPIINGDIVEKKDMIGKSSAEFVSDDLLQSNL